MAMTDAARLQLLALPKYIREEMKTPTRKSYFLREIQSRGRQTTGNGGLNIEWRPQNRRPDLTWGPGNPNVVQFPQENFNTKATLDWKTCWMGASVSEIEMLALASQPERYFKKVQNIAKK